jgi:hypothetical protein
MSIQPALLEKHLRDILDLAIRHDAAHRHALVIYDRESPLSRALAAAYRVALADAAFLDFAVAGPAGTRAAIELLQAGDFVALVQSQNFRLDDFRLRIELFQRGLATVEHGHLARIPEEQEATYVEALAYDPGYYLPLGQRLKARLDRATSATVLCAGTRLEYRTGFEPAKLNIGDYREMANVGGTFPIGEVFTEASDLAQVDGEAMVFSYSGRNHLLEVCEPFRIRIERGVLVSSSGTPKGFDEILATIRTTEEAMVREFGLGLNPAMHKGRVLSEITAFERMKGLHFSLGAKHTVYKKPGINAKRSRYHVDIYIDVQRIELDGELLFDGVDHAA